MAQPVTGGSSHVETIYDVVTEYYKKQKIAMSTLQIEMATGLGRTTVWRCTHILVEERRLIKETIPCEKSIRRLVAFRPDPERAKKLKELNMTPEKLLSIVLFQTELEMKKHGFTNNKY